MIPSPTTLERVSDTELVVTRTFVAPAEIVFDAWTRPEFVRQWWAPASRGVVVAECDADVRPGGSYRYVLARGEKVRFAFTGSYREVVRPTRLVYTQRFEPVVGSPLPDEVVVTITFEERDGSTLLTAHERHPSKEVLEGVIKSGMEHGMRETMEQLARLVSPSVAP